MIRKSLFLTRRGYDIVTTRECSCGKKFLIEIVFEGNKKETFISAYVGESGELEEDVDIYLNSNHTFLCPVCEKVISYGTISS